MTEWDEPKLKYRPADFIVKEVCFLDPDQAKTHHNYSLKKAGFTTFEAIQAIASFFDVSNAAIGFAGLKDEDGVTEQSISILDAFPQEKLAQFNQINADTEKHFIQLTQKPEKSSPLRIGHLLGNQFLITLRNLSQNQALFLEKEKKINMIFLNYYGTQRFGLPNAKKNTHLIGKAIIQKQFLEAIALLSEQNNALGESAKQFMLHDQSDPQKYLESIDRKQRAFFQSAYYSCLWNESVKQYIKDHSLTYKTVNRSGIAYHYLRDNDISKLPKAMPYIRVVSQDDNFILQHLRRHVYIQLNAVVTKPYKDEYYPGKFASQMNLFLPSGVYATVAMDQLLNKIKIYATPEVESLEQYSQF